MNFAQNVTYRFDGNWEKQISRHTGFPLKIGEFPTYFDTFSIDSVFFNLQVVTSSNWNCHVQLILVKLDLSFAICDLSLFQLKLRSNSFVRTTSKQKQDLPLLLEHKSTTMISQCSFYRFFSFFSKFYLFSILFLIPR